MHNKKNIKRTIKLTTEQINETVGYIFDTDNETPQFDWSITSTSKILPNEYGEPTTTDKVGKSLAHNRYGWYTSNWRGNTYRDLYNNLSENTQPTQTTTNTNQMKQAGKANNAAEKTLAFADRATNGRVDDLSDNDPHDDRQVVQASVEQAADVLVDKLAQAMASPKQQAIILNKIIERCNLKSLPIEWKKRLIAAIGMSDNRGN